MRMSLCMIVRQEEKALARCLEGIADAVEAVSYTHLGYLWSADCLYRNG